MIFTNTDIEILNLTTEMLRAVAHNEHCRELTEKINMLCREIHNLRRKIMPWLYFKEN